VAASPFVTSELLDGVFRALHGRSSPKFVENVLAAR
jgi:hypothetical protein